MSNVILILTPVNYVYYITQIKNAILRMATRPIYCIVKRLIQQRKIAVEYDAYEYVVRPQRSIWPKTRLVGSQQPHTKSAKLNGRRRHVALHTHRLMSGLTQEQLATKAGVTRKTIHAIEQQKSTPSVYVALAIAEALDLNVTEIFYLR